MAVTSNPNVIDSGVLSLNPTVYALGSTAGFIGVSGASMLSMSVDSSGAITNPISLDAIASTTLASSVDIFFTPSIDAHGSLFSSSAKGSLLRASSINGDASALSSLSASSVVEGRIVDGEMLALLLSVDATLSQSSVVIPVAGDDYLIVNLRTKSHSLYNDGTNDASALTGLLNFNSSLDKTVPDAYLISRSGGDVTFVLKNDEETKRSYVVTYESDGSQKIKNKKVKAAKGLKGPQWQVGVEASAAEPLYIEGIDLLVGELKRRV